MRAVDANVLVRLLVRGEEEQVRAAERFIAGGAWVSHLVLIEAVRVLDAVYGRTDRQIGDALEMLLNHDALTVQEGEVVTAALQKFRDRSTVDFCECLILETARKAGHTPLGTFDRRLATLEGAERLK